MGWWCLLLLYHQCMRYTCQMTAWQAHARPAWHIHTTNMESPRLGRHPQSLPARRLAQGLPVTLFQIQHISQAAQLPAVCNAARCRHMCMLITHLTAWPLPGHLLWTRSNRPPRRRWQPLARRARSRSCSPSLRSHPGICLRAQRVSYEPSAAAQTIARSYVPYTFTPCCAHTNHVVSS
jgi:hypothetical protein